MNHGGLWRGALLAGLGCMAACSGKPTSKGPANHPPVANAGNDVQVAWGRPVILHGVCTDADAADAHHLIYKWSLVGWPAASNLTSAALQQAATPSPFFEPDAAGDYTVALVCNDGKVDGNTDLVTATVAQPPPNSDPVVQAGADATVSLGSTVQLFAQASDPDGDSLTYAWSIATKPAASSLDDTAIQNADQAQASITPDVQGAWSFQVTVSDGRGGSATDTMNVTVNQVTPLAGSLTVTVVDRQTMQPLSGVQVAVGNTSVGSTDSLGVVTYTQTGLTGPVDVTAMDPDTVMWDHDGDPSTPAVQTPVYRALTLTAVNRPSVTLALARTGATAEGTVTGVVPASLFDELPDHVVTYPAFSLSGAQISGQFRVVFITPLLPPASGAGVALNGLLAASPGGDVPFPGNLTTDDSFFNSYGASLGRPAGPGGEPPFESFQMTVPSGTQQLVVLGGIGTLDLGHLLPLLIAKLGEGSLKTDLGSVLGSIDVTSLFVGIITVDVPQGGSVDISSQLGDANLWNSSFRTVDYTSAVVDDTLTDPLDPTNTYALKRLVLFPDDQLNVQSGAAPPDPRLAAALPSTSPYEVLCGQGLAVQPCDPPNIVNVPVDAGTTRTDLPYAVDFALLRLPPGHALAPNGGLAPVGFQFARTPYAEHATIHFAVPKLSGAFSGLSYEVAAVAFRRAMVRASDGAFVFQVGRASDVVAGLTPGAAVQLDPGSGLPALSDPSGGLDAAVLYDVSDLTASPVDDPSIITIAQGVTTGLGSAAAGPTMPATLHVTDPGTPALRAVTLERVDRSITAGDVVPALTPVWDILYPGSSTSLALPTLPSGMTAPVASGSEVWARVVGYRFRGTFSYDDFDAQTYASRRRGMSADSWSFQMP